MIYLIDSCVIIRNLNEASKIFEVNKKLKEDETAISNVIIDELKLPQNASFKDDKLETLITNMINQKQIKLIDINSNSKIKKTLDNIRSKHYRWMTDPEYVKMLIQTGKIQPEERKSFKYKDLGECSLIAIALENVNDNIIVTNDKGRIYLKPYENIFEYYPNVRVMNYEEFYSYIEELIVS